MRRIAGRPSKARMLLERVPEGYAVPKNQRHRILFHYDQPAFTGAMLAHVLCLQGYVDQAKQQARIKKPWILRSNGWRICNAEFLGALAQGLAGLGQLDTALVTVDKALARAEQSGERYSVPELLRIKCEVLLQHAVNADQSAAEDCLLDEIVVAREQGALFWGIAGSPRLARLRTNQNRQDEASQILGPVYDQFTEGFEAADLRQAKSLLEQLAMAD
jgi:hypothetical protein